MKKFVALVLAVLLALVACQDASNDHASSGDQASQSSQVVEESVEDSTDTDKPVVYTTTFSIYDFTKRIAGDRVDVKNLFEGVTDAHHWEPSPADIVNLNEADALFINGAGFEMWLEDMMANLDDGIEFIDTSEGVDLLASDHDHDHGEFDPHYWISPEDVKKQAENIYKGLVALDPEGEASFKENYEAVEAELDKLDDEYEEGLREFEGKAIVVPHKAFTYLADEYDLVQIPIEGLLADGDPNPQRMAEIVDLANEQGIQSVFYDPYGSDKTAGQIANEIGAELAPLYTLESISAEDEANGEDYFSLMRKNLESIKESFR